MSNNNQNQFKNQLNQNSFFGNFLYNQIIPEDHFFVSEFQFIEIPPAPETTFRCWTAIGTHPIRPSAGPLGF
jgi:hypothetical protein